MRVRGNGFEFELLEFDEWQVQSIVAHSRDYLIVYFNYPEMLDFEFAPRLTVLRDDRLAKLSNPPQNPNGIYYSRWQQNLYFQAPRWAVSIDSNFAVTDQELATDTLLGLNGKRFFDHIIKTMRLTERDLVFSGTIEEIKPVPMEKNQKNWVVTVKVNQVFQGEFSGTTFMFRVHSPSRAGLETGKIYGIRAYGKDFGFIVDELQWCGGNNLCIEDLLTFDDIEKIRKATIHFYEKSTEEHIRAFVEELKRGAIFEDSQGKAIGSWLFRTNDNNLELIRQPPPPDEKQTVLWYFGVRLEKKNGHWVVVKDFYETEKIKE